VVEPADIPLTRMLPAPDEIRERLARNARERDVLKTLLKVTQQARQYLGEPTAGREGGRD
jgi:hypothetical protein